MDNRVKMDGVEGKLPFLPWITLHKEGRVI